MSYYDIILEEFKQRQDANPPLSLRGFSRLLNLDPAFTCRLLKRKIHITPSRGRAIAKALGLSPDKERDFLHSIYQEDIERRLRKIVQDYNEKGLDPIFIENAIERVGLKSR